MEEPPLPRGLVIRALLDLQNIEGVEGANHLRRPGGRLSPQPRCPSEVQPLERVLCKVSTDLNQMLNGAVHPCSPALSDWIRAFWRTSTW